MGFPCNRVKDSISMLIRHDFQQRENQPLVVETKINHEDVGMHECADFLLGSKFAEISCLALNHNNKSNGEKNLTLYDRLKALRHALCLPR